MHQSPSAVNWIDEYLDWVTPAHRPRDTLGQSQHMRTNVESVAAYLEWMDVDRSDNEAPIAPPLHDPAPVRETALLAALQTESDCMHMMRRALDAGEPSAKTLQLAKEALEHARRLMENERGAWSALCSQAVDTPPAFSHTSWPDALEGVAADLHALTGKVLALQAHRNH